MGVTPWCVWTVLTDLSVWVRVGSGRSTTYYPIRERDLKVELLCARRPYSYDVVYGVLLFTVLLQCFDVL